MAVVLKGPKFCFNCNSGLACRCDMSDTTKALLEKARKHVMTAKESYEQRVSFIWGQMKPESPVTREEIKQYLATVGIHDPEAT